MQRQNPYQPVASKKKKFLPTLREFDLIFQGILDEDKIGHLLVVNIHFHQKNASKK